jgi:hypothetical protein
VQRFRGCRNLILVEHHVVPFVLAPPCARARRKNPSADHYFGART